MRVVTASEARQGLARVIEAAKSEPVLIQRQKRDVAVVMSAREYERLVNLNVAKCQRFCDQVGSAAEQAGMTEDKTDDTKRVDIVSLGRSRLWDIWFDGENVSADFMIEREQPGDQEREVL